MQFHLRKLKVFGFNYFLNFSLVNDAKSDFLQK